MNVIARETERDLSETAFLPRRESPFGLLSARKIYECARKFVTFYRTLTSDWNERDLPPPLLSLEIILRLTLTRADRRK